MNELNEPIGLYVHVPFCVSKCYYCDFPSFAGKEALIDGYFRGVCSELESFVRENDADMPKAVKSVFFGGGTPGYVGADCLNNVLKRIKSSFELLPGAEISLEANPGSLNEAKLESYLESGFNRISLGVQSLNDKVLRTIGRSHNAKTAMKAAELVTKSGFENINMDFMVNLPYQSIHDLEESFDFASINRAKHISAYCLILEEGTPLKALYDSGQLRFDEDLENELFAYTKNALSELNFKRYEISNYAKEGFRCEHNLSLWRFYSYIGFGSAAHSFYKGRRYCNPGDISEYISSVSLGYEGGKNIIYSGDRNEQIGDFIMLGLRLIDGFEKARFRLLFGEDFEKLFAEQIERNISLGLISCTAERVFLTKKGMDFANVVIGDFI